MIGKKVWFITGAGRGMGADFARAVLATGHQLVATGRDAGRLTTVLGPSDDLLAVKLDVTRSNDAEAAVKAAVDRFGRIDVLVNNAGGQFPSPAQHISPNGFLAVIKNNLIGTFHVTREVANQAMIPARRGRVINVIANIYRGFPGMAHTGAARAGVENLTMSLAVEWAQFHILVNAVAPGVILSSGTARYPPALFERGTRETPLKRAGTCEEVAAAIVFLASPAAQFITGATLRLDGGQSLWGHSWEIP
jgi:NAD(P)-dependent dehydrogenase (short-subunit alcohol dehydrogenase family)